QCMSAGPLYSLGSAPVVGLTITFEDARLVKVASMVPSTSYADLLEVLSAKYGPPDVAEVRQWQNGFGALVGNAVKSWMFADGVLQLKQSGSRLNVGEFQFVANSLLKGREVPKINF
ncbi:hypothetical protein, partial [Rhizorhabdus sp. FW153]|uniref:hypothetical protein n=1 Tax=Rhizorhabdus sp. FW153 TaxID=3400216 RepID=UPI003CF30AA3